MRYAFAGDRQISCDLLEFLIQKGFYPEALLVSQRGNASHVQKLEKLADLDSDFIIKGEDFRNADKIEILRDLDLDYIIAVHFAYIIPKQVLDIPKIGFLNLHPSFLPFNKGWHTPTWAILDKTIYGATLHFMSENLDGGEIVHQKKLPVEMSDTADSLYQKALQLEKIVFKEAIDDLVSLHPNRKIQKKSGTTHMKKDIEEQRLLDLNEKETVSDLLDKIRALTTNDKNELAYFVENGRKIGVKIDFIPLEEVN